MLFIYFGTLIELESNNVDPELVKLLLEHGAALTMEGDSGLLGILHTAMWAGADSEVISLLLETCRRCYAARRRGLYAVAHGRSH